MDESTLVWAAALVNDVDPAEVLAQTDVAALAAIVARADEASEPVDVAAWLLVGVVQGRPFPTGNAAVGWLAALDVLAVATCRVTVDRARVVRLCDDIRQGALGPGAVAAVLRGWVVENGIACPACGRRVYASDPAARRLVMPGTSRFELTARCAFEHRGHDRCGRLAALPAPSPAGHTVDRRLPVLARGACGSFLVAGDPTSVVVSPFCDDPPIVRVVEIGEICAGDLVGRWDRLVARSSTLGFVPADEARPDERGRVDVGRLRRALGGGVWKVAVS
jgi:hypothetical protein